MEPKVVRENEGEVERFVVMQSSQETEFLFARPPPVQKAQV